MIAILRAARITIVYRTVGRSISSSPRGGSGVHALQRGDCMDGHRLSRGDAVVAEVGESRILFLPAGENRIYPISDRPYHREMLSPTQPTPAGPPSARRPHARSDDEAHRHPSPGAARGAPRLLLDADHERLRL